MELTGKMGLASLVILRRAESGARQGKAAIHGTKCNLEDQKRGGWCISRCSEGENDGNPCRVGATRGEAGS